MPEILRGGVSARSRSRNLPELLPAQRRDFGNEQIWAAISTGLMTTHVQSFAVSGKRIFAGTLGGGVFVGCD